MESESYGCNRSYNGRAVTDRHRAVTDRRRRSLIATTGSAALSDFLGRMADLGAVVGGLYVAQIAIL